MKTAARAGVKSVEVQAVIIRADGTREQLGTLGYWHRNPLVRLYRRARGWFGR